MPVSSEKQTSANALIGKSRTEYKCNQVVNEVLNGNKNVGGMAKDYLKYGTKVLVPFKDTVVVSKKGEHVGIFINEQEFIHSSLHHKEVVKLPLSQVPYVFKNGYEYRKKL